MFQFQNGAITSAGTPSVRGSLVWFQFQNGAITRRFVLMDGTLQGRFQFQNGAITSKMSESLLVTFNLFQFQNGAITRRKAFAAFLHNNKFQFQNGAITSMLKGGSGQNPDSCFNSKMVRLQVPDQPLGRYFVKGFNSKMVRLQVSPFANITQKSTVSIPKWCDYKSGTSQYRRPSTFVSIPKWCDYKAARHFA